MLVSIFLTFLFIFEVDMEVFYTLLNGLIKCINCPCDLLLMLASDKVARTSHVEAVGDTKFEIRREGKSLLNITLKVL